MGQEVSVNNDTGEDNQVNFAENPINPEQPNQQSLGSPSLSPQKPARRQILTSQQQGEPLDVEAEDGLTMLAFVMESPGIIL